MKMCFSITHEEEHGDEEEAYGEEGEQEEEAKEEEKEKSRVVRWAQLVSPLLLRL